MGQAALQAHCYAGRRRGAAAGGSGRQRHDQGAPAGVMLWAVPGVPLQCPTHPASLRDTSGGLWDRQRCKRIATQAAGGAPLQGGPAGSGAARNACRCDAVGCARGASAVPHPPSLTEGHCRRVVGQAALQAHCYAGRRRGAAAGGSGRQRHAARGACRCDAVGCARGASAVPHPPSLTEGHCRRVVGQAALQAHCYAGRRRGAAAGGSGRQRAARNACRCDAVGCARGASAVPHPPSLTEGHCRRVVGQAALQAHCYAGRRRGAAAGGSGRQRHDQGAPAGVMLWAVPGVPLQCPTHPASLRTLQEGCGTCRGASAVPHPPSLTEGHCRRVVGQAALQAHCYAGRRRGAAAGGSGRQRHDQGAPAGVMLWAVPGVPLQCPTHPASLRDTAGGLWDRQRCKRIATQAAGGAPLQGGPAGSGAARNACRCDAVGCARGASAVPHPPSLTEGHCRRVVGQAALQAHCYAGRRRGAAAGGSGRQRCGQECLPV